MAEAAEPVRLKKRKIRQGTFAMPANMLIAAGGKIAMKREMNTALAP